MTALIIYDSNYGNTKLVAEAIAGAAGFDAKAIKVDDVKPEMLNGLSLLIVGSPINAWRPTVKISTFLAGLKAGQLNGVKAAAFDTRVKLFIHGNAAKFIAAGLTRAGATVTGQEGFIVKSKEGPMLDGELTRAAEWYKQLM